MTLVSLLLSLSCNNSNKEISVKNKKTENNDLKEKRSEENIQSYSIEIKRIISLKKNINDFELIKANLNKYIISSSIPSNIKNKENVFIECYRGAGEVFKRYFPNSSSSIHFPLDLNLFPSSSFEIDCHIANDAGVILYTENKKEVLRDLLIDGEKTIDELGLMSFLGQNEEFGVVFIDRKSTLFIGDQDIELSGKYLFANEGMITTFKGEDKRAKQDTDGLSGGDVNLNFKKAYGSIEMDLSGQDGGLALEHDEIRSSISGASYNQTRAADAVYYCTGGSASNMPYPLIQIKTCPSSGRDGGNGGEGRDAFPGKNGGDTGRFIINISEYSDLTVSNKTRPGLKSKAGKPQLGGLGGIGQKKGTWRFGFCGGSENKQSFFKKCKIDSLTDGKPGAEGREGREASDGEDGKNKESLLNINGSFKIVPSLW